MFSLLKLCFYSEMTCYPAPKTWTERELNQCIPWIFIKGEDEQKFWRRRNSKLRLGLMQRTAHILALHWQEPCWCLWTSLDMQSPPKRNVPLFFLNSGHFLVPTHMADINLAAGWHFMNYAIVYIRVIHQISLTSWPIFQLPLPPFVIRGPVSS